MKGRASLIKEAWSFIFRLVFRPLGIFVGIRPSVHKSPVRIDALERHLVEMKRTGTKTLSDPALQASTPVCRRNLGPPDAATD
jgi:hypothetical protein